jgi:hypothetical protein
LITNTTVDTLQCSLPPVNHDTPYIAGTRDDNVGYFNREAIEIVQQQQYCQNNGIQSSQFSMIINKIMIFIGECEN